MLRGAVSAEENAGTPLGLPRELFWDVDPAKLDVDKNAKSIISRVVELGRLSDWKRVREYYGDEKMKKVLTSLRELSPQGVSLCCAAFGLRKEDFRCFSGKPFPPAPWIY